MYKCNLCPRKCAADRENRLGRCGEKNTLRVSRAALHLWEEPCISGKNGSGTVFFSGCSLGCVYCQNSLISQKHIGKEISVLKLSEIFLLLAENGAHNINLVTADHFAHMIKEAVIAARKDGLKIPIILNTSSYINPQTLKLLADYIDIYLADFKYIRRETANKYSNAADYPIAAKNAVMQMFKNSPEVIFDETGMMKKGVLIRHMVLPGHTSESKEILKYLHDTYGDKILLSIMNQYTPLNVEAFPEINRTVTNEEYDDVLDYALSIGIEDAFVQEGGTAKESFIPDFEKLIGLE